MALKDVLQQFLSDEKWECEISHDEDDNTDFISTRYDIGDQTYRIVLIANDDHQTISVLCFSPLRIPKSRAKEATFVLNFLNTGMLYGNFVMSNDGGVTYRWGIDVEGVTASTKQFRSLVGAASAAFDEFRSQAIAAAAFSKQSGEDVIKDFEERLAEKS